MGCLLKLMRSCRFADLLKVPTILKEATCASIDKSLFRKAIKIDAISVASSRIGKILPNLQAGTVLKIPRIKTIVHPTASNDAQNERESRLILLEKEGNLLSDEELNLIAQNDAHLVEYELVLDYSYWQADDILGAILPDGMNIPSSFETVGHIAHLNLRDEQLPFKHAIGQVIMDKNPSIRTVLNKTANISNTFRVFPMELVAGEQDFLATVKEQGCTFRFDFSKVYWNSRLQTEHERLTKTFQRDEYVCDVFAGVGPFAIPAVKNRGCTVYANDLNPESVHWLRENAAKNKIDSNKLAIYNEDARQFIRNASKYLQDRSGRSHFDHYVMNLPAAAISFLHHFQDVDLQNSPLIHCYLFVKDIEGQPQIDPVDIVKEATPQLEIEVANVQNVRSVAPLKTMYCVSFRMRHAQSKRNKLSE